MCDSWIEEGKGGGLPAMAQQCRYLGKLETTFKTDVTAG